LIVYPRYWDPVSGLPCPVEVALDRLNQLRGRRPSLAAKAAALAGRAVIAWRRIADWRTP
jgi:capsular polysaccharide export protein